MCFVWLLYYVKITLKIKISNIKLRINNGLNPAKYTYAYYDFSCKVLFMKRVDIDMDYLARENYT